MYYSVLGTLLYHRQDPEITGVLLHGPTVDQVIYGQILTQGWKKY